MKLLRYSIVMLLAGCASKSRSDKQQFAGNEKLAVIVAPGRDKQDVDPSAITFLAAVTVTKDELQMQKSLSVDLQYGVDSSFYIMKGRDTVWPSYVMPVANGQPLRPQYIVEFERSGLENKPIEFRSNMKGLDDVNREHVSFTATELKNPSK
jgi:hypothetical protein